MFQFKCAICSDITHLSSDSIRSVHRTSEGLIAYVACPEGHTTLVRTTASAIEKLNSDRLQAQLAQPA